MNKSIYTIALLSIVLLAFGCSKNQRYVNRIDGTWDITRVESISADGNSSVATNPDGSITFDKCNIREGDFCTYTQQTSYTFGSTVVTTNADGLFLFDDKGDILIMRESNGDGTYDETRYNVTKFTRKVLEVEDPNEDGSKTVYTLER